MPRLPIAAVVAALPLFAPAVAFANPDASNSLHFAVLRDGKQVGSDTIDFHKDGKALDVTVDTDVVVKIAFIPVYRFEHHDAEVWRGGRLVSLASKTNDDGTHHNLKVAADPKGLSVDGDNKPAELPAATIPASLWNPATVRQKTLMNTLDGHVMGIKVADLGTDTVNVHGRSRQAHHYAVTGDLKREVWYDADGTLVQVRFKAKDDSKILYVLQ